MKTINGTKMNDVMSVKNVNGVRYDLLAGAGVFYGNGLDFVDVNGGLGSDLISLFNSTDVWSFGNKGTDHFRIEGGAYNFVLDSQGPSLVQLVNTNYGRISLGNESDVVSVTGGIGSNIETLGGADKITITDPEKGLRVNAGDDADNIRINFNKMLDGNIDLGFIRTGSGPDTIEINAWMWGGGEIGVAAANVMLNLPDFDQSAGDRLLFNGRGFEQVIVDGGNAHFDAFGPEGQPMRFTAGNIGWQKPDGILDGYTFATSSSEGWG